jgi:hypothetical protein
MTVFLGIHGSVELRRTSSDIATTGVVEIADVSAAKDRFSFDFADQTFYTGDRISITTTDGTLLSFIDASGWTNTTQQSSGSWYVNVDAIGGLKLYNSYVNAIVGNATGLASLTAANRDIPISVKIAESQSRIIGNVTQYELNNSREAVDVTVLSDDFRQQASELITGSGTLSCFFDHTTLAGGNSDEEASSYFHHLILRQQFGSKFFGKFYVVPPGMLPGNSSYNSIWFEFEALITNSGLVFDSSTAIESKIDFVTTGEIKYKIGNAAPILLQEDRYKILDEFGNGFAIV